MTNTDRETRIVQILLALDAGSHDLASVESAVTLAARLQAELLGLFVEDTDLLRIAQLPFAQEVALSTALDRALGGGELERSLRVLAAEAQRSLAEAAARARVKWSFRTVRGRRLESALAEAGATDLLLLGRSRRGRWQRHEPATPAHTVYVLFDGSEQAVKALAVVAKLAVGNHTDVVILDLAPQRAGADLKALANEVKATGAAVQIRRLGVVDLASVVERIRAPAPALVVLPGEPAFLDSLNVFEPLLARLDCPLLIVR